MKDDANGRYLGPARRSSRTGSWLFLQVAGRAIGTRIRFCSSREILPPCYPQRQSTCHTDARSAQASSIHPPASTADSLLLPGRAPEKASMACFLPFPSPHVRAEARVQLTCTGHHSLWRNCVCCGGATRVIYGSWTSTQKHAHTPNNPVINDFILHPEPASVNRRGENLFSVESIARPTAFCLRKEYRTAPASNRPVECGRWQERENTRLLVVSEGRANL
jgi:hypothetical protein